MLPRFNGGFLAHLRSYDEPEILRATGGIAWTSTFHRWRVHSRRGLRFTRLGLKRASSRIGPKTKRTPDGSNFAAIYPLGLVPLLRLDDGSLLGENAAILQYIANRFPESNLARARLQQWLSFIGTELHQRLFCVLLDAPKEQERIL